MVIAASLCLIFALLIIDFSIIWNQNEFVFSSCSWCHVYVSVYTYIILYPLVLKSDFLYFFLNSQLFTLHQAKRATSVADCWLWYYSAGAFKRSVAQDIPDVTPPAPQQANVAPWERHQARSTPPPVIIDPPVIEETPAQAPAILSQSGVRDLAYQSRENGRDTGWVMQIYFILTVWNEHYIWAWLGSCLAFMCVRVGPSIHLFNLFIWYSIAAGTPNDVIIIMVSAGPLSWQCSYSICHCPLYPGITIRYNIVYFDLK